MPKPSSRLDLYVVPEDPDGEADLLALEALGRARAWWRDDGQPGEAADALVPGGFRRARWWSDDTPRFYANQQGGVHVRCPETQEHVVAPFARAMTAWRAGGPRTMSCPACGGVHDLAALTFQPPAAFARTVLHLAAVEQYAVTASGMDALAAVWGPVRWVGRRTW